ncbi:vacuolar ATPase assembly integral membrane protein vma21 [Cladophialophora chaetospira]|uniref:Vacuolar ATPase assembly integral membrane protein vma21 n=1 Tax=Cladophialophora chaetospira TaxID=386627 RepID=A0AA39CPP1_9EURO|nr:vacuolar ATPase assembly integral membrane protein vma21 [Cladophialophora chaetospira]
MATRRNVPEKTISEAQGGPSTSAQISDTTPAVPAAVIYKLLGFTAAMICIPIGSYFLSVNTIFKGKSIRNASYAGAFAAILANVVLVAYIIVAMREDQSENIEAEAKRKKGQ